MSQATAAESRAARNSNERVDNCKEDSQFGGFFVCSDKSFLVTTYARIGSPPRPHTRTFRSGTIHSYIQEWYNSFIHRLKRVTFLRPSFYGQSVYQHVQHGINIFTVADKPTVVIIIFVKKKRRNKTLPFPQDILSVHPSIQC
jgi:hypothetical protein